MSDVTSRDSDPAGLPTIGSLVPSAPPRGTSPLLSACVAIVFVAFCLLVQDFSGSWSAGFVGYPDEPSHFVGATMFREWVASGHWFAPLDFARNYYDHYPYFAVGYWPPLFSLVAGLWMLVAGVGRLQALFVPAVCAAGTAWLIFHFVRQRAGAVAGVCAGTLYLSLPEVRQDMCAVMVDHMTAVLCLAAAACLLRYLGQPILWNGVFFAVVGGCAILSKYSAAYIFVLSFLAILLHRRFELLRKPSFLVQVPLIGLLVGPWMLWTRKMAFYGLPSERSVLTPQRALSFVVESFEIFPPVLLVLIVVGLVALLLRPRAWRNEIAVLGLLCAGHLALLIVSPVEPEARYLLVPAAVFLVASFAGWAEVPGMISYGGRWASAVPAGVAILTVAFVISQFRHSTRMPQDRIGEVVSFIVKNPARAGQSIVVPPDLEGPVIAEFAAQSPRPNYSLVRPGKTLAHSDWFGLNYSSVFETPADMLGYFQQHPVNLILSDDSHEATPKTHVRIMSEMLRLYPLFWHQVRSPDAEGETGSLLTVYEYSPPLP